MGRRLFVGNLPYEVGETDLQELFGRVGAVESVTVVRDQATGRARGFAFVEMSTDEGAARAIAELNETALGGRTLAVNEARPRPERSGGGFGGGRSGGFGRRGGGGGGGRGGRGHRREPRW
jgi:cold-inducible RNA-binding protein